MRTNYFGRFLEKAMPMWNVVLVGMVDGVANRKAQILKTGGSNELLAHYEWQFAKFINIDLAMARLTVPLRHGK